MRRTSFSANFRAKVNQNACLWSGSSSKSDFPCNICFVRALYSKFATIIKDFKYPMSVDIKIKKGLNINLVGAAEQTTSQLTLSNTVTINLGDFYGITPKMLVKVGAEVKAGEPIFYNKDVEDMMFVSPVSGELVEIERGAEERS